MKRQAVLMLFACCMLPLCAQEKESERLKESYNVLKELLDPPTRGFRGTCWTRRNA